MAPKPSWKDRFFSDWRYPVATFKATVILGFLAFYVLRGHQAYFHNPTPHDATVTIDGKSVTVPAGGWISKRLTHKPHSVDISFKGGRREHMTVNMSTGKCFRDFRAYSLAPDACYAMVSVGGLYGGDGSAKIVHTYRQRTDLEHGVDCEDSQLLERYGHGGRINYLAPTGPLPKEVRGKKTPMVLKQLDCEVLDDPQRRDSWLDGI